MSKEELRRVEVMARVRAGGLKLADAAAMLAICYRQAKRLWRQYQKQGPDGLKHGNAGRRSNQSKWKKFRPQVLQLVRQKYSGAVGVRFGPTLAAQYLLEEDGLKLDSETLRQWRLSEGPWSQERKRKQYRQRRNRRGHLGELVQMDRSFHAWQQKRGPGRCLRCRLGEQETIWAGGGVAALERAVRSARKHWIPTEKTSTSAQSRRRNNYRESKANVPKVRAQNLTNPLDRGCASRVTLHLQARAERQSD